MPVSVQLNFFSNLLGCILQTRKLITVGCISLQHGIFVVVSSFGCYEGSHGIGICVCGFIL